MIGQERIKREEITIERRHEGPPLDGQVILFEQYALLRRSWKWMLILAILVTGGVAAYVYTSIPVEYMATVRALPPNKSGTPLDNLVGGIASSLKDFGIAKLVGSRGGDNGYSKSVFIGSQPLYDSLIAKYDLYTVYDIPAGRRDIIYGKLDGNIKTDISPDGPISVDVYDVDPKRAAELANDVIHYTNVLAREMNRRESEPITRYVGDRFDSARVEQERLGAKLKAVMQNTKIYDPEGQSKLIGTALVDAEANVSVQRGLVATFTKALGADDPRTEQAKLLLQQAEEQSRRLSMGNAGVLQGPAIDKMPAATIEFLKVKQDYEVNGKVIAILQPLYEQTQFEELRDIPVLNVLDKAFPPVKKARPKRSLILASAFVGTLIIGYLVMAVVAYFRNFRRRYRLYTTAAIPLAMTNGDGRGGDRS